MRGEHDGYGRLKEPVTHRRMVALDPAWREVTITDDIVSRGSHDVALTFHFAERCSLVERDASQDEPRPSPQSAVADGRRHGQVRRRRAPRDAARVLRAAELVLAGAGASGD